MLVSLNELLAFAEKKKRAIGAVNVPTLEALRAAVDAAEELQVPIILQHAEVHEDLISLAIIGPVMLDLARKATVPIAVHLDHGTSFNKCIEAIQLGFSSVMYDGSALSFEENQANTKEIVKIAHAVGVNVEAELGSIGNSEIGGHESTLKTATESMYTDPQQAKKFVEETQVDCLAIAFGTIHGLYKTQPILDLARIAAIKEAIDIPLVMHGGSGVSETNYQIAINNGIRKINYYTYMNQAGGQAVTQFLKEQRETKPLFFDELATIGYIAMKENVKQALSIFSK